MLRFYPSRGPDPNPTIKIIQIVFCVTFSAGIFHCVTLTFRKKKGKKIKKEGKKREEKIIGCPDLPCSVLSVLPLLLPGTERTYQLIALFPSYLEK